MLIGVARIFDKNLMLQTIKRLSAVATTAAIGGGGDDANGRHVYPIMWERYNRIDAYIFEATATDYSNTTTTTHSDWRQRRRRRRWVILTQDFDNVFECYKQYTKYYFSHCYKLPYNLPYMKEANVDIFEGSSGDDNALITCDTTIQDDDELLERGWLEDKVSMRGLTCRQNCGLIFLFFCKILWRNKQTVL